MAESEAQKACPYCGEMIRAEARKCRFCSEYLDERMRRSERAGAGEGDAAVRWLVPVGRSGWAIAAGYLGLLSCIPFVGLVFGLLALVCGVAGLRAIRQDPELGGQGRAWFGIIAGGLLVIGNGILWSAMLYRVATGRPLG